MQQNQICFDCLEMVHLDVEENQQVLMIEISFHSAFAVLLASLGFQRMYDSSDPQSGSSKEWMFDLQQDWTAGMSLTLLGPMGFLIQLLGSEKLKI